MVLACSSDDPPDASPGTTAPREAPGPVVDLDVPLTGRPADVAADGDVLWVADDERGVVVRLDAADGSSLGEPIAVSPQPAAIDVGDGVVWVADPDGTVTRVDSTTGSAHGPPLAVGGVLVDVLADGRRAWVADIEAGVVRSVDADTDEVGPPIEVPGGVVRLVRAGPRIWVSGVEDTITPLDPVTGTVGEAVAVGTGPIGLASTRDVLWVANSDDDTVSRLDPATGRSLGNEISVGDAPVAVVIAGGDSWVLDQDGPSLTRIGGAAGGQVGRVSLPMRPRAMVSTDAGIWVVGVDPSAAVLVRVR
jgi:DNA-binding beta-propeller fold protein YncE